MESSDLDLIIEGIPFNDLVELLENEGTVDLVGKSYYVIKFTDNNARHYDITIPRTDRNTGSGHKAFEINPCDTIEEDLGRRDFTINAIAYDIINQKLVDPYDGLRHLESKMIEVTYPESFIEDPLRIIRALRFSSKYDFTLSLLTHCLLTTDTVSLISDLSKERIIAEIAKLNTNEQRKQFSVLWCSYGIDHAFVQDAKTILDAQSKIKLINSGEFEFDYVATLYFLFLTNLSVLSDFPLDRITMKNITIFDNAIIHRMHCVDNGDISSRDVMFFAKLYDDYPEYMQHKYFNMVLDPSKLILTKELAINGDDILKLGFPVGELIGKLLLSLRVAIYYGMSANTKESLIHLLLELR